jgi:hypothetical protein
MCNHEVCVSGREQTSSRTRVARSRRRGTRALTWGRAPQVKWTRRGDGGGDEDMTVMPNNLSSAPGFAFIAFDLVFCSRSRAITMGGASDRCRNAVSEEKTCGRGKTSNKTPVYTAKAVPAHETHGIGLAERAARGKVYELRRRSVRLRKNA